MENPYKHFNQALFNGELGDLKINYRFFQFCLKNMFLKRKKEWTNWRLVEFWTLQENIYIARYKEKNNQKF